MRTDNAACNAAKRQIKDVDELRSQLTACDELPWISTLLIRQSGSGARIFVHACAC